MIKLKAKVKTAYNKHRHNFAVSYGEIVMMTRAPVNTGLSTKHQERYSEPLVVTEGLPNDMYQVSQLADNGPRHYVITAHISQLKS